MTEKQPKKSTAKKPTSNTAANNIAKEIITAQAKKKAASTTKQSTSGTKTAKSKKQMLSDAAAVAAATTATAAVATAAVSKGKTKKQKGAIRALAFVVVLLVLAVGGLYYFDIPPLDFDLGLSFGKYYNVRLPDGENELKIHFINVGQGDSILLQFPDGKAALIDGGDNKTAIASKIISYINKLGITQLDFVMLTHTDSDHCGSLDSVINSDDILVKKVYMPYTKSKNPNDPLKDQDIQSVDTNVFSDFVQAVLNERAEIAYSYQGMDISTHNSYSMILYSPNDELYNKSMSVAANKNNVSPIIILTYGSRKIALTGDADDAAEKNFLKNTESINVGVDVLKVAHHGGRESTSKEFLSKVTPQYAVISVGSGNSYGHPTPETLGRLSDIKCKIFRTDKDGDIVLAISGGKISWNTTSSSAAEMSIIKIYFAPHFASFRKAA